MTEAPALFSLEEAKPLVGDAFSLRDQAGNEIVVSLTETRSLGFNTPAHQGGRESFVLTFHAPAKARMPQGIYTLKHPRLGAHGLFVVPIGLDARGMGLEVIFNFS